MSCNLYKHLINYMYSFYFNKSNISNIAIDNSNRLHDILDYIENEYENGLLNECCLIKL